MMEVFKVPNSAKVNKPIPKNAFDVYTNTSQKKLFIENVARMTWLYKLSTDTINLPAKEIKEIEIINIELKVKTEIQPILNIIDKAMPYFIIFIIEYDDCIYLSTSTKHPHPSNENKSVIDWTFKSEWFYKESNKFYLDLKKDIDTIYKNFCIQLTGEEDQVNKPLEQVIEKQRRIQDLEKEIEKLKGQISKCMQFNRKVELNMRLKEKEGELKTILC